MPVPMPQHAIPAQYMPTQRVMQAAPEPPRRAQKPTDKNIPDGVEDVVIGGGVEQYKSLRDLEKRLDASVVRKRLDIQDSISKTVKKYRTMRIWITNTVENQPWQGAGNNPGSGRYKVRIEGRLLDDHSGSSEEDEGQRDAAGDDSMDQDKSEGDKSKESDSKKPSQRFSHFFKTISVDFDKPANAIPDEVKPVNWSKPQLPPNATSAPPNAEFDSIQFARASQDNLNITIGLVRDETPERFKLSKELAEVLDVEEETRSGIVLGIWDYIRAMELQEDEEKRTVRCDHRLYSVCNVSFHFLCPDILTFPSRFSVVSRCSSRRFLTALRPTPALLTLLSFPTPSVLMKNSTKIPLQPSMTSRSLLKILFAPR